MQATTTERSQINLEQQLCWHFLIESEWDFQRRSNVLPPNFDDLHHHFMLNLDETCFMCCEGVLRIIGSADKNITIKIHLTAVSVLPLSDVAMLLAPMGQWFSLHAANM